jgi:hypothetical protein
MSRMMLQVLILGLITMNIFGRALSQEAVTERVGGNFKVSKIEKLARGGFSVNFVAAEGSPKISHLHLESDHINAGLQEGDVLRLSADVVTIKGHTAEVSQIVIFLPGRVGPTPVWMISKRVKNTEPPAKLIEMHAPSTDYAVF